jgi:ABC-type transport system involved in multi-copper enzyme maturation permease subunit
MEVSVKTAKVNPWLPYWAVLLMDVRQTLRSWVYRSSIAVLSVGSIGYLLHRAAVHHQAGIVQSAAEFMGELLQFALVVGTTLTIILTAGAISGERGTMADSVLSRGISRYQYFLGKWHARLVTVLGSFLAMGIVVLVASCFLVEMDLSIVGCIVGLLILMGVLSIVASAGVTISSLCNSTVLGIAILFMVLYGIALTLAILGYGQLNPLKLWKLMPTLLEGKYDLDAQAALFGWCMAASVGSALVGLVYFARRDV